MAYLKKQKVVLRQKVKTARWHQFKIFCSRSVKFLFFASLLISSFVLLYRFLFISDFFLIKWIEVYPVRSKSPQVTANMPEVSRTSNGVNQDDEKIVKKIRKEVDGLKGQSIFKVNLTRMEKQILQEHPELKICNLTRSLPDKIKMHYGLRQPIAWISSTNQDQTQWIDEEAIRFPAEPDEKAKLPQLIFSSSAVLPDALSFLKMWSISSQGTKHQGAVTPSLGKLILSDDGEITLLLSQQSATAQNTEILWGNFDSKTFAQKFQRLQDVWEDLKDKGFSASQINLHSVPEKKVSVLDDTEIVGRVFVRLR